MKSLANIPKIVIIAVVGVVLLAIIAVVMMQSEDTEIPSIVNNQNGQEQQLVKLSIDDIEDIFIHSGLDIECPNLKGVSQNGYVYSVVLNGKQAVIERMGCGVGEPEVFAAAIAQDLEINGNFEALPLDQMLEKMTFKFYEAQ